MAKKKLTKEVYLKWYEDMLFWRKFEDMTSALYIQQKIRGFLHLYNGQEAVLAGALLAMEPGDKMITAYRNHVQPIGLGVDPRRIMAELMGKVTGTSRGKGGSMHMFSKEHHFYGGHGIVGGHIPIGTGVGFAIKYRGGDQVVLCFMGEAAVNNGAFHESLNMAALWKLPCIFIIENNRYGMGTAVERASAIHDIYKRGASYDMPRDVVDGQDVFAVAQAARDAIARARTEQMPTLLEVRTYRFMGHSMSDAVSGTYRTKEELEQYLKRDPITLLKSRMEADGDLSAAEYQAMEDEIKAVVQDSIDFAEQSPEPSLDTLYTDVLVDTTS